MSDAASTPASPDTSSKDPSHRLCGHCNSRELRRRPRSLTDKIFSIYRYKCNRCASLDKKFKLTWQTLPTVVVLVVIIGGSLLLWLHPPSFTRETEAATPQSQAESLAKARASMGGALSQFEQIMIRKPKSTMDNATVLQLWKANVGTSVILQLIRTSNADYDLSADAIIQLKQAGVEQPIILAMIDASYATR